MHTSLCKQGRSRAQVSAHQAASPGCPGQLFCTPEEPGEDTKGDLGPRSEGRLLPGGTVIAASARAGNAETHAVGAPPALFPNDGNGSNHTEKPGGLTNVPRDR